MKAAAIAVVLLAGLARAEEKRLLNCDFTATEIGDCDATGYLFRVAAYAVPGILVALITLFTCPAFFCARKCCGCCGGDEPTTGCCCASQQPALYSTLDIIRPKVYAMILVALGVGVGIWGNVASDLTVKGLLGLIDDLEAAPPRLLAHIDRVNAELIVTRYNSTTDREYQEDLFGGTSTRQDAVKVKEDIEDVLKDNADTFRSYVLDFSFIMFIIFSLPIASVVLGGLAAICNCRSTIPMLTAFIMFVVGFLLWLSHGIFSSLAVVSGDLCAEVTGLAEDRKTVLVAVTGCDDSIIRNFTSGFKGIEGDVARDSCISIQGLCYDESRTTQQNMQDGTIFNCATSISCTNVRFGDLVRYVESGLYVDDRVNAQPLAQQQGYTCNDLSERCTPARCADMCRDTTGARSAAGKLSKSMYTSFLAAAQVASALDTLGGQYGSCSALAGLLLIPFEGSCTNFARGSLNMRQSSGLGGITVIGFVYVMAWGSKRFMALPEPKEADEMHALGTSQDPGYDAKKDASVMPEHS